MIAGIKTLDDFDVKSKTVLLRVDINSPIDSNTRKITDDTRINGCVPTIMELSKKGARTVVLAHQGDPLDYHNFTMLEEHAQMLEERLCKPVKFIDDVAGPAARQSIKNLKKGEILLLDNVRIHTEETIIFEKEVKLSPEQQSGTILVSKLAPLADIYLGDAFAAVHRSQPSLVGFPQVMSSGCGRLFEQELRVLTEINENPKRPCIFILGGAKILDAFSMMEHVLTNGSADKVLCIGLTGEIMLIAAGFDLGRETINFIKKKNLEGFIEPARKLLKQFKEKLLYPSEVAIIKDGKREEIQVPDLPVDKLIQDIGHQTIEEFSKLIAKAGTIFMNGPAGVYEEEESAYGTRSLWQAVAESDGFSVIGGGDTIAAAKRFNVCDRMSYVCTAGGGLVLFLSGKSLPVIEALRSTD